jgi:hypothetical protein
MFDHSLFSSSYVCDGCRMNIVASAFSMQTSYAFNCFCCISPNLGDVGACVDTGDFMRANLSTLWFSCNSSCAHGSTDWVVFQRREFGGRFFQRQNPTSRFIPIYRTCTKALACTHMFQRQYQLTMTTMVYERGHTISGHVVRCCMQKCILLCTRRKIQS